MALERLSPEDARILALERGVIAGHTLKLVIVEAAAGAPPPGLDDVRAHIAPRLDRAPRLRQRLAPTPLGLARPAWVDDETFALERHVRAAGPGAGVDDAMLRELVSQAMCERLDRSRPLWSLQVVEGVDDRRTALIWKLHHCMADGQTAMRLAEEVLWQATPQAAPAAPSVSWQPRPAPGTLALAALAARDRVTGRSRRPPRPAPATARPASPAPSAAALRRELSPARARSPLDRRLSSRRTVAFAPVPLTDIKAVERAAPARVTVNDVVLAIVAGALRGWLEHGHGRLDDLRVQVPVSLHHAEPAGDGQANRDSFLCATLPLGEADCQRRLALIGEQTAQRKRDHDPEALDDLFAELRRASPTLERFANRLSASARVFALSVSNVRGPVERRYVAGAPVSRLYSLAEIAPHHALRVSVVSMGDSVRFGLCADPMVIDDLDVLAAGVGAELEALTRAGSGRR